MTTTDIEKRLTALEAEVANLKSSKKPRNHWWERIAGVFANNPRFENAMRHGRQWQEPRRAKSRPSATRARRKAAK